MKRVLWWTLLVWLGVVTWSRGQESAGEKTQAGSVSDQEQPVAAGDVQQRIEKIQGATALDNLTRTNVLQLYGTALERVENGEKLWQQGEAFKSQAEGVSNLLAQVEAQLQQAPEPLSFPVPTNATVELLEQRLKQAEEGLKVEQEKLRKLQAEPERRSKRVSDLAKAMAEAKTQLQSVGDQLKSFTVDASKPPELTEARRMSLRARQQYREREIASYEKELKFYEASGELIALQRDLAAREVARRMKVLELGQQELNRLRREKSEQAARQARDEAEALRQPFLARYAETNLALAQLRVGTNGLTARIEEASTGLTELKRDREYQEQEFEKLRSRVRTVEAAGQSIDPVTGWLLRRFREKLRSEGRLRAEFSRRQEAISRAQLDKLHYQEERTELVTEFEARVTSFLATVRSDHSEEQLVLLGEQVRKLFSDRIKYLGMLIEDYENLAETLEKTNDEALELSRHTHQALGFIDERILRIRSSERLTFREVFQELKTIGTLLRPRTWLAPLGFLLLDLAGYFLLYGLVLLGFALLFRERGRFAQKLEADGEVAARRNCVVYRVTLRAVLFTVALAVPVPLVLAFLGWRLAGDHMATGVVRGVPAALLLTSAVYLTLAFVRQLCRERGLAQAHFGWPDRPLKVIDENARWLMRAGLPLFFLMATVCAEARSTENARLMFMIGMGVLGMFLHRLLDAQRGVWPPSRSQEETSNSRRLNLIRFYSLLGTGLPVLFAGLAWFGYELMAMAICWRLLLSFWVVGAVVLTAEMLRRWLLIAQRKLAIDQARKRRAAMLEARKAQESPVAEENLAISDEPELIDIQTVKEHAMRLLRSAVVVVLFLSLWGIWVDILPALNVLDRVTLWHLDRPAAQASAPSAPAPLPGIEGEEEVSPAPVVAAPETEIKNVVTLADLCGALLVMLVTLIASRNLPGLLEITVLRRLDLQPGGGYAITTLVRYVIILVGMIIAFGVISVTWSTVQWLAAAVTVGIGFGLQEIFANFVSGLIILFERPIRVGDIVTVGDVSGKVTRIQIRATTITDWDNKELLLPNKEFITGRLVNWTLSDPVTRIVVPVGIAYGSDTRLAQELMLKVAGQNAQVLKEPAPQAWFVGFGDNSLNFELRFFVGKIEHRLPLIHQLHFEIDQAFRKAGIEIAFPQRDIHIRSLPPGMALASSAVLEPSPPAPESGAGPRPAGPERRKKGKGTSVRQREA